MHSLWGVWFYIVNCIIEEFIFEFIFIWIKSSKLHVCVKLLKMEKCLENWVSTQIQINTDNIKDKTCIKFLISISTNSQIR